MELGKPQEIIEAPAPVEAPKELPVPEREEEEVTV